MITIRKDALAKMAQHRPFGYVAEVLDKSQDLGDRIGLSKENYEALKRNFRGVAAGGVGTELKKLLSRLGITAQPGCSCLARANAMDARGVPWCRANVETIVDWLQEEAAKRGLPFVRLAGKAIVHLAIRRALTNKGG